MTPAREPDGVRVVDAHCHVLRSEDHGRELWSYFLGKGPAHGDAAEPCAHHTVDEAERLMDETGVERMNILMFTWSGRYWRDGQYTLPDGPGRAAAGEELRRRIVQRVVDNNDWAVRTSAAATPVLDVLRRRSGADDHRRDARRDHRQGRAGRGRRQDGAERHPRDG